MASNLYHVVQNIVPIHFAHSLANAIKTVHFMFILVGRKKKKPKRKSFFDVVIFSLSK